MIPWSDDVQSLMKTSDVFFISSDYEGYVMTAMEAAACGLPVVMTDVGGAGEFTINGENGIIVNKGDAEGLAKALESVLYDAVLCLKLRNGAKRSAESLPSYSNYVARIKASWQKALKS